MSKRKEKARRRARAIQGTGIERAFREVMHEMTPRIVEVLMNASGQPRGDQ